MVFVKWVWPDRDNIAAKAVLIRGKSAVLPENSTSTAEISASTADFREKPIGIFKPAQPSPRRMR